MILISPVILSFSACISLILSGFLSKRRDFISYGPQPAAKGIVLFFPKFVYLGGWAHLSIWKDIVNTLSSSVVCDLGIASICNSW